MSVGNGGNDDVCLCEKRAGLGESDNKGEIFLAPTCADGHGYSRKTRGVVCVFVRELALISAVIVVLTNFSRSMAHSLRHLC